MSRQFELVTVDGELEILGDAELAVFFDVNEFDADTQCAIESLAVGEEYKDGGGATCTWSIKRIESVR